MKNTKRILSVLLSALMVTSCVSGLSVTSAFAAETGASDTEFDSTATVILAGSAELLGTTWDTTVTSAPNEMELQKDGTYKKVIAVDGAYSGLQFKVVDHGAWYGDETGNNITFNVTKPSDVTITYDPETHAIEVTGDGVQFVTSLDIDAIYAVGNGDEAWLNGIGWEPAAEKNKMTEVEKGVYEITFKDVEEFDNYEVKFAANGTWNDSWGIGDDDELVFGQAMPAVYNGKNIAFEVAYELANVTLRIDLNDFDYATKTGGTYTITVEDASDEPAEFDSTTTVILAGSAELLGTTWDTTVTSAPNEMKLVNGKYTKTYTVEKAVEGLQFKVVDHGEWYGDETGNNVTFNVTKPSDVTITYDPETHAIEVTGDGVQFVTSLDIDAIYAVGNGDEAWLNGIGWDPAAEKNKMTEVEKGVYEITFTDVEEFDNYEVKFAANGTWNDSWGIGDDDVLAYGEPMPAVYNGNNIAFEVPYELANVTLRIDLNDFDYATKTGGTYTITVEEAAAAAYTLKLAVPNGGIGAWDGAELYYNTEKALDTATILTMKDSGETVVVNAAGLKTLGPGNYKVYTVGLTEAQAAAIDDAALVGFRNANGDGRTGINLNCSVTKAPNKIRTSYNTTAQKVADLDGKMFIIDGCYYAPAETSSYKGYWATSGETFTARAMYIYAPTTGKGAWSGVELFYGDSATDLKTIKFVKGSTTRQCNARDLTTVESGAWSAFFKSLTLDQVIAIDSSKIVGIRNTNGAGRTPITATYDISRAPSTVNGSYGAKLSIARRAGWRFIITGCSNKQYEASTYTGFWYAP